MKIIETQNLPKPNGHYSHCIEHNGVLYLSGQLPIDAQTREIPHTIAEQTQLVLNNAERILKEAGVTRNEVIQARVYIAGIELWEEVNKQYSLFFGEHKPVRSIVPVAALHYGCLLEVEIVAQTK